MSLSCPTTAPGNTATAAPAPAACPATMAQQRIWTAEQALPGRALHNVPLALSFEGPLENTVLEQALNDVVARHEILRTRFEGEGGQVTQIVTPSLHVPLPVIDLRLLPPAAREAQAFLLAREEASRPFDLRRIPLLRAQLYVLNETHRIFVLTVHQMIFDGRSRVILLRELAACYDARRQGRNPRLPELRAKFSDHARWQAERLPALEPEFAWWADRLSRLPPPLSLPSDKLPSAIPTGKGRVESLALPPALPLETLAHDENVTVSVVLLAAFQALLQRYTGANDIVVATSNSGRQRPETEDLIGLFRNTVIMRTDLSGDPSFRTLLGRVRATYSDALSRAEVPFEKIAAKLGATEAAARPPGCQIFFAHDRRPLDAVNWPGLRVSQLELDSGAAKHDLALHIVESPLGFTARAEYDCDRYSAGTIQRLLTHFGVLLRGAVAMPNRPLSTLPLITEAERRMLIGTSNESRSPFPRDATVHSLIASQAARVPTVSAITCGDKRLAYSDLDDRANQLARHLQASAIRPGVVVGLLMERGPDLAVAALAVLKSGGAIFPLDCSLPPERLAAVVEGADISLTLCSAAVSGMVPASAGTVVVFEEIAGAVARLDRAAPPAPSAPDDLACVIVTRGKSGTARRVNLTHRALVNCLHSLARSPGVTSDDVILSVSPCSTGAALLELLLPLTVGARVVFAPLSALSEPARLDVLLVQNSATILQAAPPQWEHLLAQGWSGRKTVRLFCSGDRLTRNLADRLLPRCRELWHLYGTAETSICTAAARVTPNTPIIIGRPIANAQLYLLDRHLNPVPVGLIAEIHVGGESLASGYRGSSSAAEPFVPDPFRREPGARLFATGDLGRRLPGGEIEFIGRAGEPVAAEPSPTKTEENRTPALSTRASPRRPNRQATKNTPTL